MEEVASLHLRISKKYIQFELMIAKQEKLSDSAAHLFFFLEH